MKLVDMKRAKRSETKAPAVLKDDPYGYGLRITLDADQIDKLGIDMPKAGAVFEIEAVATVTRVSQSESAESDGSKSIELQIRKLGVEKKLKSVRDAIDTGIADADADE
jgi:hypothetical protein